MKHDPTDWKHCTACAECNTIRKDGWVPQTVMVGTVPGGSRDTPEFRMHMDWDKDLNAYRDAKAEGLQPKQTTAKAVRAAQVEVKSHEAALRDASKVGIEFPENIKVAAGVDKEKYFKELI